MKKKQRWDERTLKLVCNVARVVEYPPANYGYSFWLFDHSFPIYGLLGVARVDHLSVGGDRRHRYWSIGQLQTATAYAVEIDKYLFYGNKILDIESDFRKLGSVAVLQPLIRIQHASLVQTDTEMAEKYANQRYVLNVHWKICRMMCDHISGPGDLDLWPWNWYASRIKCGEPSFRIWAL